MTSFQAKIGCERPRKRQNNKKNVPMGFHPTRNRKFQKNYKKYSKANIVWKRPRKRENKNYRFIPFLPDA